MNRIAVVTWFPRIGVTLRYVRTCYLQNRYYGYEHELGVFRDGCRIGGQSTFSIRIELLAAFYDESDGTISIYRTDHAQKCLRCGSSLPSACGITMLSYVSSPFPESKRTSHSFLCRGSTRQLINDSRCYTRPGPW